MFLLPLLLAPALAADDLWFYPGPGAERVEIDPLGRVGGMVARRTGRVLARVDDPALIASLPEVSRLDVLGGDGHVVLLTTRDPAADLRFSRALHDRPDVRWAHPDLALPLRPSALPDDPYLSGQWHLENDGSLGWTEDVDIDAETAWALATGKGGLVAIVDTGTDTEHPDLSVIGGYDYIDGDADPNPDTSVDGAPHGTATAGLAAALGGNGLGVAGVAYDSDIYAVRLIGGDTTLSDLYDSFVDAVDQGAWVLSNSWGFDNGCSYFPTYSSLEEALDYAEESGRGGLGTAVVVSAGNGSCDNSGDGFLAHEAVIGVAASSGWDVAEWYSSFGDGVDVTAPSGNILTTDISGDQGYGSYQGDPDYSDTFSGTSASAPIVSGVLLLMFEANPRLTAAQAREVLCQTSIPIDVDNDYEGGAYDSEGWSPYYGCGRVDAGAAVLAVANTEPSAPVLTWPSEQAVEDRVLLRWEGADADLDRLSYVLSWSVGEDTHELELDEPSLDLSGEVAVGDVVSWQVQARDLWGLGPVSEVASFEVVAVEEEPPAPPAAKGCQVAPGGGVLVLILSVVLGCAPRRSPAMPSAAPTPLVSGQGCTETSAVPTWTVQKERATLSEGGLEVVFPEGYSRDPDGRDPRALVLLGPQVEGSARLAIELMLIPVCTSYYVPAVQDRLTARSLAHLVPAGASPTVVSGNGGIGDGLFMQSDATVGEISYPLWFRWVEVVGSSQFTLALAASCARVEGYDSACAEAVRVLVDATRAGVEG